METILATKAGVYSTISPFGRAQMVETPVWYVCWRTAEGEHTRHSEDFYSAVQAARWMGQHVQAADDVTPQGLRHGDVSFALEAGLRSRQGTVCPLAA